MANKIYFKILISCVVVFSLGESKELIEAQIASTTKAVAAEMQPHPQLVSNKNDVDRDIQLKEALDHEMTVFNIDSGESIKGEVQPNDFLSKTSGNGLQMLGWWSYSIDAYRVEFWGDRVENNRNSGCSGTLKLEYWVTTEYPVYGESISHYRLGDGMFLGDLKSGSYFYDIYSGTQAYGQPPRGIYYVTIALLEYQGNDRYYVDLMTFDSRLRWGADTGDDHGDDPSHSTFVSPNSSISGQIEQAYDHDWFKFQLEESATVTIETTGNSDTVGELFNHNVASLEFNDDGGDRLNFHIRLNLDRGVYYLKVRGYGQGTGPYTLRVSSASEGEWEIGSWVRETPHNYFNDRVYTATYNAPWGARQTAVHFKDLKTEQGWDFLNIYDDAGNLIHCVSGHLVRDGIGNVFGWGDGWVVLDGTSITLELVTDSSVTDFGFETNLAGYRF